MYLREKTEFSELLSTIIEFANKVDLIENRKEIWIECIDAIDQICDALQKETVDCKDDFIIEKEILKRFENRTLILSYLEKLFQYLENIQVKIKVAFMPYKASMWDSLNTIYESAVSDDMCDAQVIPLPYYEISQNENVMQYEIAEFSKDINTIDYREYSLEVEMPDIIFIHNIYDKFNTITRLPEEYFTEQLKKYTSMLVYVPYHISSPYKHAGDDAGYAYMLPWRYVDKVVYCGKFVEEEALKYGVPKEKILTLGSPKFDMMYNIKNRKNIIPNEWEKKLKGKKVILLNTGCMDFVNDIRVASITMELVLDMVRFLDDVALIWRPHPLARVSLKKYAPQNLYIFDMYYNGIRKDAFDMGTILDDTANYFDSINASDILISGISSILDVYAISQKPILFLGDKMPQGSLLPKEAYYYFQDPKEPWCFFIKKFLKGYDPNKKIRENMYDNIYENIDGTSGSKIYEAIKNELIEKSLSKTL